jgi:hypothetical protein
LEKYSKVLTVVRDASREYQLKLAAKREGSDNVSPNFFQKGDHILFRESDTQPKSTKIAPRYRGPYLTLAHSRNMVTCKHVVTGEVKEFHSSRLKLFAGTPEQAYDAALRDQNQFVIAAIHAWTGNPTTRSFMQFEVEFADGTIVWKQFDSDLWHSAPFEAFCSRSRPLRCLNKTAALAAMDASARNRLPISEVGAYVLACTYTDWSKGDNGRHLRLDLTIDLLPREDWKKRSGDWVWSWGCEKVFDSSRMILLDVPLLNQFILNNPGFSDWYKLPLGDDPRIRAPIEPVDPDNGQYW